MLKSLTLGTALGLTLGAALPAFSQTTPLQCGPHQVGKWLGDTPEASDITGAESPLQTALEGAAGSKVVMGFKVSDGARGVVIEAQEQNGSDPEITLFNAAGNTLGANDDHQSHVGGLMMSARLDVSLAAGDYCLVVGDAGGQPVRATVQVAHDDQARLIQPGSHSGMSTGEIASCGPQTEATQLGETPLEKAFAKTPVTTRAAVPGTTYHRFELGAETSLALKAEVTKEHPDLDPKIALFREDGSLIAENDDTDGLNSRLDFLDPLAPGKYCLGVTSLSTQAGNIAVTAQKLDRATYLKEQFAKGNIPAGTLGDLVTQPLDLSAKLPSVMLLGDEAVWYDLTLGEETMMIVTAYGSQANIDTIIKLYDEQGQSIQEFDDSDDGTDAKLGPRLMQPGKYLMAIAKFVNTEGNDPTPRPVMLSVERFVRAQ